MASRPRHGGTRQVAELASRVASGTGVQVYRQFHEYIGAECDRVLGASVLHAATVEQPLRAAEFAARVADLAVRETGCCSFFTFALTAAAGALHLDITVVPGHIDVLDALAAQATATTTVEA